MTTTIIIIAVVIIAILAAMLVKSRESSARMQEQVRLVSQEQAKLREDSRLVFRDVASQLLAEQSKAMKQESEQRLSEILTPFRDNLDAMKRSIDTYRTEQVSYTASLKQQIKDLSDVNRSIGQEAKELTQALRGEAKVQGDWGELVLKQILDMSGLQEGVNYKTQVTRDDEGKILKGEEGNRLRPDVVFFLPDGKKLVIDSKVSLTAYAQYVNAPEDARKEILKSHITSVKKHITELANIRYDGIQNSADFVMMFIPNEPAYLLAMSSDESLWEYAYKHQVVIVSPTHLISVVKLIDQLWQRDRQTKNALQIAEEAGKMYDKLAGFVADMETIDKSIDAAHAAYENAMKKLATGNGNLLTRAQKVKDLGAKAAKQLPTHDEE